MTDNERLKFAHRLRDLMILRGYEALRSELGADPEPLRRAAEVSSLESARKWLRGDSMPGPEKMKRIATWLGVTVGWLRDGEEPEQMPPGVREELAPYGTSPVESELLQLFRQLDQGGQVAVATLVRHLAQLQLDQDGPELTRLVHGAGKPARRTKKTVANPTGTDR